MASSTFIRPSIGRIPQGISRLGAPKNPTTQVPRACTPHGGPSFSTTSSQAMRQPKRDKSRLRGLSSIYRSGPKARSAVKDVPLPIPANYKPKFVVDPDHGLWQFFYKDKKLLPTPNEDGQHGRPWTVEELRKKDWNDLHKLWWVCVKERNRISTAARERSRLGIRNGNDEATQRDKCVLTTMKAIKFTLTERFYAWEDARDLAKDDEEIDLSSPNCPYQPREQIAMARDKRLAAIEAA